MGMSLQMSPGKGPTFDHPLDTSQDIKKLNTNVDVRKELGYVLDAITLTRKKLNGRVPLFGFIGAPWTLMGYMIEGGGSKTYTKSKSFLYKYPEESKELLQRITDICIEFLAEQVMAGAQVSLSQMLRWLLTERLYKFLIPGQGNYLRLTLLSSRYRISCKSPQKCMLSWNLEAITPSTPACPWLFLQRVLGMHWSC